ncbi:VanZ family protein [Sporosarcina sp. G11-34]|uniref:VanZ family protein n=1 Tax=Sporosarcina sp. G11-34 TaxID=2849605 RepID=UPI0022A9C72B|nr:VanZ family protein [Sporosarcina sp. G11-34]MCZ2257290.1 VanZ family protein [Sporosarcina sp. G11-34]
MKKLLMFFILLAVLSTLFFSSGQTYEQQSLVPSLQQWLPGKPLEGLLSKLEIPYWGKTISVEERGYYYFIEFLLRKGAHFFIFGVLAVLVYSVLPNRRFRTIIAAAVTLLVAMSDEFHQSLTGGRTPSMQDVGLDMAGAVTFLVILRLALLIPGRRKSR